MNVDIISRLIQQVNGKNLSDNLFYLAKDPLPCRKLNYTVPGHSLNTLYETDKFIQSKLESYKYNVRKEGVKVQAYGCDISKPKSLQYALPPSDSTWYTAYNLYAKKRGKNLSYETIVVVSHKDSQSWVDSPGAYDNAAGVAGSMEIARILADYESKHSIWFLYCNEEHTPWTSIAAANNAKKREENLIAIFNLDGIGGKSQEEADADIKSNVALYYNREGKQLADLMEEVNSVYKIGLTLKKCKQNNFVGTDADSFIKAGYPRAITNIGSFPYADPDYHSEGDIPELVDLTNVRMTTQAVLAAILKIDSRY